MHIPVGEAVKIGFRLPPGIASAGFSIAVNAYDAHGGDVYYNAITTKPSGSEYTTVESLKGVNKLVLSKNDLPPPRYGGIASSSSSDSEKYPVAWEGHTSEESKMIYLTIYYKSNPKPGNLLAILSVSISFVVGDSELYNDWVEKNKQLMTCKNSQFGCVEGPGVPVR